MQRPPVAPVVRRGREPRAGDVPERGAGADEHREHGDGEQHGDRVGEEAGDQPGVLHHLVVLEPLPLRRAPRRERRRVALGSRRAASLGHVGGGLGERGRQVADGVETVPVRQPARRQQPLGRSRVRRWPRRDGPAGPPAAHRGAPPPRRTPRGRRGPAPGDADRQVAEHPDEGAERQPDGLQRPDPGPGVGEQGEQRGAALLVVGVAAGQRRTPQPAVCRLGVEDHGLRHRDGLVAGRGGAPAEVEVVAEDRQLVVEPAELVEDAAAYQHAGGVDGQDVARLGVLALVVLAALQPGLAPTGPGDRDAELEQPLQRGPLAQHRAEHVGVGVVGRAGQQGQQRLGVRAGVVVQHPDPLGVGAELVEVREPGAQGGGEAGRGRQRDHAVPARRRPRAGRRSRPCCRCRPPRGARSGPAARPAPRAPSGSQRSPSWLTSTTATSSRPRAVSGA